LWNRGVAVHMHSSAIGIVQGRPLEEAFGKNEVRGEEVP